MYRSFAVVPAAGHSARMGAPKLLLPLGDRTVIEHVLGAWIASRVTRTVVVVRADDELLLERCRQFSIDVVTPAQAPRDMKASVALALAHIAEQYAPSDHDAWLLAPADLPGLSPQTIEAVLAAYDPEQPTAIAPEHRGTRGHPTLLPWAVAHEVRELAPEEGVSALVARTPRREIRVGAAGILVDIDDPVEYARLAHQWPAPMAGDETAENAPVF